ncbi:MAG: alanine racemase, partial [Clostridia bacterium]|nr:alanine racemase [Clostridia bacterium]
MNRIGFPVRTDGEVARAIHDIALIRTYRSLSIEGLFTHFARADEASGPVATGLTATQRVRFVAVRDGLATLGLGDLCCHVCNSAAAIRFPDFADDAVRVGISLYGCEPSDALRGLDLRPVMRLRTLVSHVHTLPAGETVGYGGTFRADGERRIATLPVGYADGFLRAFGGARVRIETASGEILAPIVGRICMDQCTVDVTDTDAAVGDKVTLLGSDPEDIRDLARRAGTIPYEVLCLISARVPRLYL